MHLQLSSQVTGVFENQEQALEAVQALRQAGFLAAEIAMSRESQITDRPGPRVDLQRAATSGGMWGAAVGGCLGALAGALGALVAASVNPLLLVIFGAAAGATAGCYLGPFVALEKTESEAHDPLHHVEQGRTLVIVHTADRQEEARSILVDHGAYDFSMA